MNDNELKKYTADLDFKIKQECYKCIHEQNRTNLIIEGATMGTVFGLLGLYVAVMFYVNRH